MTKSGPSVEVGWCVRAKGRQFCLWNVLKMFQHPLPSGMLWRILCSECCGVGRGGTQPPPHHQSPLKTRLVGTLLLWHGIHGILWHGILMRLQHSPTWCNVPHWLSETLNAGECGRCARVACFVLAKFWRSGKWPVGLQGAQHNNLAHMDKNKSMEQSSLKVSKARVKPAYWAG